MDPLARTSPCPSREVLAALGLGTLSGEAWDAVAEHVQTCTSCSSVVESLSDGGDDLVDRLRELKGSTEPIVHQACELPGAELERLPAAREPRLRYLPPGTRLREYRLLERIGEGGMGTVYRAVHTRLERLVALKVLGDERLHRPDALARFQREMKAVGKINHPNVVQATDAGETDGTHFLVMELVDGIDVARMLQSCRPLSIADACELVRQASLGLSNIHQHGLIHRDIKPSNLILTKDGTVKILDLGLARLQSPEQAHDGTTSTGLVMGSFDYLAPEQADDAHAVDARADLYSLGCTMFQLLTGQAPFSAPRYTTPLQKMKAHENAAPPTIQSLRSQVPRELAQIVARLLAKKPAQRFASAGELAAALHPFASGSDLPALVARAFGSLAAARKDAGDHQLGAPAKAAAADSPSTHRTRRWPWASAAAAALAAALSAFVFNAFMANPRGEQVETPWTALFNGQDLTGWKSLPGDPDSWSVHNGVLVGRGPAPSNLYSQRGDFKDFHLRVEANVSPDEDSGIFFRIPFERLRGPIPYEAQIVGRRQDDFNTGSLWGLAKLTDMPAAPGEWFNLEIVARGNRLVLKVNGRTTVDHTDERSTFASGHIALQHFKELGVVQFRKVEIMELPPLTD